MSIGYVLGLFLVDTSCSKLEGTNGLAKLKFPGHVDGSLEG